MKIALINASPKARESVSGSILRQLQTMIGENDEYIEFHFRKRELKSGVINELALCDCLVFAFPLYVDGLPSQLLSCLKQLEGYFSTHPKKKIGVYCLVNCGFYEGIQTAVALDIMKNWCYKAGLSWGQGVGIGSGGMILSIENIPVEHRLKKNFSRALDTISGSISSLSGAENVFIDLNFPRFLYKLAGDMGWRWQIKKNGLKVRDLNRRISACTSEDGHA